MAVIMYRDPNTNELKDVKIPIDGSGGEGTVKSVNNIEPDENGNVQLSSSDVGALPNDTQLAPADAEKNIIDGITMNGVAVLPDENRIIHLVGGGTSSNIADILVEENALVVVVSSTEKKSNFIPMMTKDIEDFGTASLSVTPYGKMYAYYAFDEDANTCACGGTSATDIDLSYVSKNNTIRPTTFYIKAKNSGTHLLIQGLRSVGNPIDLVDVDIESMPLDEIYYVETQDYFYGFRWYITNGSKTNTPQIITAQVVGYVK